MNNRVVCVKNFLCLGIALGSFSLLAMEHKKENVFQLITRLALESKFLMQESDFQRRNRFLSEKMSKRKQEKEQAEKKRKMDDETQKWVNKKYKFAESVKEKPIEQNVLFNYASLNQSDSVVVELQSDKRIVRLTSTMEQIEKGDIFVKSNKKNDITFFLIL